MAMAGKLRTSFEDSDSSLAKQVELLHKHGDTFGRYYRGGCCGSSSLLTNNNKNNDLLSSSSMHQTSSNSNNNNSSNKTTSLRRKILRRFSVGATTSSNSNPSTIRAMQQGLAVAANPATSCFPSTTIPSDEYDNNMFNKRPKSVSPERSSTISTPFVTAADPRRQSPRRSKSSPMEYPSIGITPTTTTTTATTSTTGTVVRRKILRRFSVGESITSSNSNSNSSINPLTIRAAMQQGLATTYPVSSYYHNQSDEYNNMFNKRPKTVSLERSSTTSTAFAAAVAAPDPRRRQSPRRSKSSPMEYPSIGITPTITTTATTTTPTSLSTGNTVIRSSPPCSPQNYLDSLLRSRGYSTMRYDTLHTAYYNHPTSLQMASYNHEYFIKLLRKNDHLETFRAMLNCGISTNPCCSKNNQNDDDDDNDDSGGNSLLSSSLLHLCCQHGNFALLRMLLYEFHVPVQVGDVHGRTPLHYACGCSGNNNNHKYNVARIPSYEAVELLLNQDVRLLYFCDDKGCTPLEYIPKSDWSAWMVFLRRHRDVYWPALQHHIGVNNKAYYNNNNRRASLGAGGGNNVYNNNNRRASLGTAGSGNNVLQQRQQQQQHRPPPLALLPPNSRPLPDPIHALPPHIAARVASGNMSPEEATQYRIDALLSSCHNNDINFNVNSNNGNNSNNSSNKNDGFGKMSLLTNNSNHDNHSNNDKYPPNDRLDKMLYWKQKPQQSEKSINSIATSSTANRSIVSAASGLSSVGSGDSNITSITWDEQETAEVLRSLMVPLGTAKPIAWCGSSNGGRGGDDRGGGDDCHQRSSSNYNNNGRSPAHVSLSLGRHDVAPRAPPPLLAKTHDDDEDDDDDSIVRCSPPPLPAKASTWCAHPPPPPSLVKATIWCVNEAAPQHLYFR